jgi:hypothetical protein
MILFNINPGFPSHKAQRWIRTGVMIKKKQSAERAKKELTSPPTRYISNKSAREKYNVVHVSMSTGNTDHGK